MDLLDRVLIVTTSHIVKFDDIQQIIQIRSVDISFDIFLQWSYRSLTFKFFFLNAVGVKRKMSSLLPTSRICIEIYGHADNSPVCLESNRMWRENEKLNKWMWRTYVWRIRILWTRRGACSG